MEREHSDRNEPAPVDSCQVCGLYEAHFMLNSYRKSSVHEPLNHCVCVGVLTVLF